MKRISFGLLLVCVVFVSLVNFAAAQSQMAGTWTIQPARDGYVQLSLRYSHDAAEHSQGDYSSDVAVTTLGLTRAQLNGADRDTSFSIVREPGTVAFTGTLGHGTGAGRFTFTPSAAYAAALTRRGIDPPDLQRQFAATMLDLSTSYIDAMASAGYPAQSFDRLITFRALEITPAYASELRDAGVGGLDADRLVQMKALRVDARYVKELADAGYPHLTAGQLTQLRALHVDRSYINRLRGHGMKDLSVEDLIRLKALNI